MSLLGKNLEEKKGIRPKGEPEASGTQQGAQANQMELSACLKGVEGKAMPPFTALEERRKDSP